MSAGNVGADGADLLRFIRQGRSFSGHEPHCFFLNTGTTRFADLSAAAHLNFEDDGRAVGLVDWDHDGDIDLWVINRNGPQLRFLQNSLPNDHHFVALRLRGTTCNRDAIGARVEIETLEPGHPRLTKTLRAGDGYLAQSSKWLHFGLGRQKQIERLVVHWPDGDRTELGHLKADRRYVIRQGRPEAHAWRAERGPITLAPLDPLNVAPPPDMNVLSVSNVPMPALAYRTFDGQTQQVFRPGSGQLVLLNLWASWCQPCLVELAEWTQGHDEITSVGLDVVALNIDQLDGRGSEADKTATDVLTQMGFPFRTGVADAGLVEKLQLINNHLFDLHLPLPVPTSVLIDGQGRLAAIYKGRVALERLLQDVKTLGLEREDRRKNSVPFAGRWHEVLNEVTIVPVLDSLIGGGFLLEADDYVRRIPAARKERLLPALVRLGMEFYRGGDGAKAQEHFGVAVRIDPKFVGVETALGVQREQEGRADSAIKLYREALRRNPQSLTAMNNLAWLLATHHDESIRDGVEAVRIAEQAARLTRAEDPQFLDTLAAAYAEANQFEKAIRVAQNAHELSTSRSKLALARAIAGRLRLYRRQQPYRRDQ